ncbi:UNVERIFIED_CONTAM: hypothetical protein K2H54_054494 [Gekko kuhli]
MASRKGQGHSKGKGTAPKRFAPAVLRQGLGIVPSSSEDEEESAEQQAILGRLATLEQAREAVAAATQQVAAGPGDVRPDAEEDTRAVGMAIIEKDAAPVEVVDAEQPGPSGRLPSKIILLKQGFLV